MKTARQILRSFRNSDRGSCPGLSRIGSVASLLCSFLIAAPQAARADIYIWAEEVGGSTTFRYEGSFDRTGLTYLATGGPYPKGSFTVGPPKFRTVSNFQIYPSGMPGPKAESLRMPGGLKFPQLGTAPRYSDDINQAAIIYGPGTTLFGWYDDQVYAPDGYVSGTFISGSATAPYTLAALVGIPTSFSFDIGNGSMIHMFMMPPVTAGTLPMPDREAEHQVMMSALPLNQTLTGIGQNAGNAGTRDFGNRLFRNRTRFVPQNGATTSVGDFFNNRGRELSASRYERLSGSTLDRSNTVSLSPRFSSTSSPTTTVASGSVSLSDSSPFLSAEVPAGDTVSGALAGGNDWVLWASTDYGRVQLDDLGATTPGMESNSYSSAIGFEYAVSDSLSLGLGWSHLWNDNTLTGGLGSVDVEGDSIVTYATWFRNNFWADALYSYGSSEADIARTTGFGTTVRAMPDIETHQASLNLGYNFGHDGGRIVHGPTFGATYTEGTVDGYTETGDPRANTRFAEQDFESLITRLGWQANWQQESTIGLLRPQVRIAYGRENLNRDRNAFGTLVPNVANNNTVFGIGQSTSDPGEGWMELGAGLGIEICESCSLLFDYETQVFRENATVHYGSAMVRVKF